MKVFQSGQILRGSVFKICAAPSGIARIAAARADRDLETQLLIREITRKECLELLARVHLGRLACAKGAQPYIVPLYFAYEKNCLYGFSTVGQKVEWMRENPMVCLEADEIVNAEQWVSVVVLGTYEELPDKPEWENERAIAHNLLQRKAGWWEPGYVKTIVKGEERPLVPHFFRIHIVEITGRQGIPKA